MRQRGGVRRRGSAERESGLRRWLVSPMISPREVVFVDFGYYFAEVFIERDRLDHPH